MYRSIACRAVGYDDVIVEYIIIYSHRDVHRGSPNSEATTGVICECEHIYVVNDM